MLKPDGGILVAGFQSVSYVRDKDKQFMRRVFTEMM